MKINDLQYSRTTQNYRVYTGTGDDGKLYTVYIPVHSTIAKGASIIFNEGGPVQEEIDAYETKLDKLFQQMETLKRQIDELKNPLQP